MRDSLRALLSGTIDYAGLFPPAGLTMSQALLNYVDYRNQPEAWLLGRFVVPAARLHEMDSFWKVFSVHTPFVFSALGRGGQDRQAFAAGLQADLEAMRRFLELRKGSAIIDAFEVKTPPDAEADLYRDATKQLALQGMNVVFEVPLGDDWETVLPVTLARLGCGVAGVKLRTGGLEASAFPSPHQLAAAIETCRHYRLPLKCTAGLHHPLRHYNDGVKTHMHGFLNVILACVLARTHGLGRNELERLLKCESAQSFVFEAAAIHYEGHRIDLEQLRSSRQEAFLAFGSCSFDEPRSDLRALGLL